jgi:hypothetical protein
VPASADGMAPRRRVAAKVILGPKRSHDGPASRRTRRLRKKSVDERQDIEKVKHTLQ